MRLAETIVPTGAVQVASSCGEVYLDIADRHFDVLGREHRAQAFVVLPPAEARRLRLQLARAIRAAERATSAA